MPLVEATRTDRFRPVDDQMANLKITVDHGPTRLGAETGRTYVVLSSTRRLFSAEPYDSHAQFVCNAPTKPFLPLGVPLGRKRIIHERSPDVRRRAEPFNSHPVSNSSPSKLTKMFAMDGVSFEVFR